MTVFTRTATVRFAHCDPAGIIFFPQFFALLNEAVEDWFAGPLGHGFRTLHVEQRVGVPTVRLEADFVSAARLGDVLTQRLWVLERGGSSLTLQHEAERDGASIARFRQTLVYVDLDAMRARPWPQALRERIDSFRESTP